jgi:hypothetical protein
MNLEQYINPHVMRQYRFTGKFSTDIRDLRELVFHRDRFDLMAKLAYGDTYLSRSVSGWRATQYREHIRSFNNFDESDGSGKCSEVTFFDTFHGILRAESTIEPCSLNVIPVNEHQMILDGSHRLVRAYLRREPIHLVHFQDPDHLSFDYMFFNKRKIDKDVADSIAFEYGLRNDEAHCLILFPCAGRTVIDIWDMLPKYFDIFYHKEIRWSERAPHNMVATIYHGEPWLGSFIDGFAGAVWKYKKCFNIRQPAQFYIVTTRPGVNIVQAKKELRYLIGLDDSVHTSVNEEEKIGMMRLFLNNNTLRWANNARPYYPSIFIKLFNEYRQAKTNSMDGCLTGSSVYGAYGIRDVGDLDYVVSSSLRPFLGGDANNEHLVPFLQSLGLDISDILENPACHFYYFGHKIIKPTLYHRFKMRRREARDLEDFARGIAFQTANTFRNTISYFTWPMWQRLLPKC